MRLLLLLTLAFSSFGGPVAQQPKRTKPKVTIELARRVFVPGHEILLGDIARLVSKEPGLDRSLASVVIGRAPKGSWMRKVSRTDVLQALGQRGVNPQDVAFGAKVNQVEVMAATERIPPSEIVKTAETVLRALLREDGELDALWQITRKPRPVVVPVGRKGRDLTAVAPSGRLHASSALIRVDVEVDGKVVTSVPLSFRIQRFREVLVALRALQKGKPIDPSAVALRRVDVAGVTLRALTDVSELRNKIAARTLRSGSVLTENDLRRPAIIQPRDEVTVVVKVGRIRVARSGVANQSGAIGDAISISISGSQKPLRAIVTGPGFAEIRRVSAAEASSRRTRR